LSGVSDQLGEFILVFVPLFVAMDPLGALPFLVPFLGRTPPARRGRVVRIALLTGLVLGLAFLALGRMVFDVLGIQLADFLVAGGLILLVLALRDMIGPGPSEPPEPDELLAVVPIGTPLLIGPAAISMLILLSSLYGYAVTLIAFVANMVLAWIVFRFSARIGEFLGRGGLLAMSRVADLLLAAIAIQLIRRGVVDIWTGLRA